MGDMNTMGGEILTGSKSVLVAGRPVAGVGSMVAEHAPWNPWAVHSPHICSVISSGSLTVKAEFRPVAKVGSTTNCGHSIATGNGTVLVV
jgi:uncharacterized Zn-binding protein involved in type VI secretion